MGHAQHTNLVRSEASANWVLEMSLRTFEQGAVQAGHGQQAHDVRTEVPHPCDPLRPERQHGNPGVCPLQRVRERTQALRGGGEQPGVLGAQEDAALEQHCLPQPAARSW